MSWVRRRPRLVRRGAGTTVRADGSAYTVKVNRDDTDGALAVLELHLPPGGRLTPHLCVDSDVSLFMLAGDLRLETAGEEHALHTGDFLYVPAGSTYAAENEGADVARLVVSFTRVGHSSLRFTVNEGSPP